MSNLDGSRDKFKQSSTLGTKFLLFFILAVSLPILALVRIGYDSYSQKISLAQRKVFGVHENLASTIEDRFRDHRKAIENLNQKFYRDKVFKKLPGSLDRRLWFNEKKDFLSDLTWEQNKMLRLHYFKHFKRYKKVVWKALSTDSEAEYDPWKMPIKMQIFIWEQALNDPTYHSYKKYNVKGIERPIMYSTARPPKYEHLVGDRYKYFKTRDIDEFESRFPMHQIFYTPNAPLMNTLFDQFSELFKDILKFYIFGNDLLKPDNHIERFSKISGVNFLAKRNAFLPLKVPGLELDFYWNVLPVGFNVEAYKAGKSPAPLAIYGSILDIARSEAHFLGLMMGENRTSYLAPITSKLNEIEEVFNNESINFSVIRNSPRLRKNPESVLLKFSNQIGYNNSSQSRSLVTSTDLLLDGQFLKIDELIGFLSQNTGEFILRDNDLKDFLNNALDQKKDEIESPNVNHLFDLMVKLGKPLFFTYSKHGEQMLGTLYPSSVFSEKSFFFSQSQESFRKELRKDQLLILSVILFSLILVLVLGHVLSRSVVKPILQLTTKISRMAEGKYDEKVSLELSDEIGQLGRRFNEMAEIIKDKLFQMRSIGVVNLLMNHDLPRRIMLKYILHLLCIKYQVSFGSIGFFEGGLSSNSSDYPLWKNTTISSEEQKQIMENIVGNLYPQQKPFLILDGKQLSDLNLPFENAVSFFTSPDGKDSSSFKDSEKSIEVYGMMFLANLDDELLNILRSESDYHKNPVFNLCNQAKTVVLKTLLDEIEGDTIKGQEIQESLMPSENPISDGCIDVAHFFKGARGLAGDYLDVQTSADENLIHFSIADVSGKGIGPSLFGAKSRAFMKVLVERYPKEAGKVLAELNENLCYNKKDELFLTMFYCVLDLNQLMLFYASAGHNKMLLIKSDGQLIHLSAKGVPAGLFSPMNYESKQISVEPGDSILLYTDGVTELENAAQDLYGQERFESFCIENRELSAKDFVLLLNDDLDDFRKGIFPSDDITYVAIRVLRKAEDK